MTTNTYDRAAQDVGNIVQLEHVNVWAEDQRLATAFYVFGLGLTRDPYLMVNIDNMGVNGGRQEFHLITKPPQALRRITRRVVPSLWRLQNRPERVKARKLREAT